MIDGTLNLYIDSSSLLILGIPVRIETDIANLVKFLFNKRYSKKAEFSLSFDGFRGYASALHNPLNLGKHTLANCGLIFPYITDFSSNKYLLLINLSSFAKLYCNNLPVFFSMLPGPICGKLQYSISFGLTCPLVIVTKS